MEFTTLEFIDIEIKKKEIDTGFCNFYSVMLLITKALPEFLKNNFFYVMTLLLILILYRNSYR